MFKLLLFVIAVFFSAAAFTQSLYKVQNSELNQIEKTYKAEKYYQSHNFSLVALPSKSFASEKEVIKDFDPETNEYFLIWLPKEKKVSYINMLKSNSNVLYFDQETAVIEASVTQVENIPHGIHSGIVKLNSKPIKDTKPLDIFSRKQVKGTNFIEGLINQVEVDTVMAYIQHMEDYGTRKYNSSEAVEAQNWIKARFESYGLTTETTYAGVAGSENVIAYQPGFVYSDKYVVVGGHYDSTSSDPDAPGADDNASGTAGVMEIARILSQYEFNYTIIYCAWSAEEIGLYGSGEWASEAASQGMEIIGYLNLDMIGYLKPGGVYHTDMMAPASAQPLVDIYEAVAAEYVPDFEVNDGTMIGGDSDHTSFNNNGYMGIFPFEDSNDYSPYIHSDQDLIGPSVNNTGLVERFTKVGLAFMAVMAEEFNGFYPPMNLIAEQANQEVSLTWEKPTEPAEFLKYYIYRNSVVIDSISDIADTTYVDTDVLNGNTYEYYVTALFGGSLNGESNGTNTVSLTVGLLQTHIWDFEDGMENWIFENDEAGWMWNVPVSISGNSTKYMSVDSDDVGDEVHAAGYAISPQVDLSLASVAYIEFDYGLRVYSDEELSLMYRTDTDQAWVSIENLGTTSGFVHSSIEIPVEAYTATTQFAFHYDDNNAWGWYTAFDNVEIIQAQYETHEAPTQLTASLGDNEIQLSWEPVVEADFVSYKIYRNDALIDEISLISQTEYIDVNNLVIGTEYTYYITANYLEGESNPSNTQTIVYGVTGIYDINENIAIVYPNPATKESKIHIDVNYTVEKIQLFDLSGKLIIEVLNSNRFTLNDKNLNEGIYLIEIKGNDIVETCKLIIN
jgi:Zn-dependent M28 family amino/carboxypeptidase